MVGGTKVEVPWKQIGNYCFRMTENVDTWSIIESRSELENGFSAKSHFCLVIFDMADVCYLNCFLYHLMTF